LDYQWGMAELTTTSEVIETLGGNPAVAELTGRNAKAVSAWRSFDAFPPDTFLVLTNALEQKGETAPVSLWRMVEPAQAAE
jgi:ABC-type hemin transport system substrate-binding protein